MGRPSSRLGGESSGVKIRTGEPDAVFAGVSLARSLGTIGPGAGGAVWNGATVVLPSPESVRVPLVLPHDAMNITGSAHTTDMHTQRDMRS